MNQNSGSKGGKQRQKTK